MTYPKNTVEMGNSEAEAWIAAVDALGPLTPASEIRPLLACAPAGVPADYLDLLREHCASDVLYVGGEILCAATIGALSLGASVPVKGIIRAILAHMPLRLDVAPEQSAAVIATAAQLGLSASEHASDALSLAPCLIAELRRYH